MDSNFRFFGFFFRDVYRVKSIRFLFFVVFEVMEYVRLFS